MEFLIKNKIQFYLVCNKYVGSLLVGHTCPTITFECKFVQKGARIVQKMSKKVQEKLLLEQFGI